MSGKTYERYGGKKQIAFYVTPEEHAELSALGGTGPSAISGAGVFINSWPISFLNADGVDVPGNAKLPDDTSTSGGFTASMLNVLSKVSIGALKGSLPAKAFEPVNALPMLLPPPNPVDPVNGGADGVGGIGDADAGVLL